MSQAPTATEIPQEARDRARADQAPPYRHCAASIRPVRSAMHRTMC